jgi:hypothetical protein
MAVQAFLSIYTIIVGILYSPRKLESEEGGKLNKI